VVNETAHSSGRSATIDEPTLQVGKITGNAVTDDAGAVVGRVVDLVARFADDGYPPVTGVIVKNDDAEFFIPTHRLSGLSEGAMAVSGRGSALTPFERRPGEVLLERDVLGRQLIFLGEHHRGRLVRAAGIVLAERQGQWQVVAIDTGRRRRWSLRGQSEHTTRLDWSTVEPFLSHVPTSRLRLRFRRLVQMHPGEIADLVEEASPAEADEIIEAVGQDRDFEADVFEELDQEHQLDLVAKRSDQQVADLLDKMAADDAADLLAEIERDRREPILALMSDASARRLRNLLRYNPQSAGGLMSPGGLCLGADTTIGEALERLRRADDLPETVDTVLVVDDQCHLMAAVRLLELVRAPAAATLGAVAHSDPPRVRTSADLVEVTLVMTDYNLSTLAVVDDDDHVVGVITIDDIVEQLVPDNWRRRAEAGAD